MHLSSNSSSRAIGSTDNSSRHNRRRNSSSRTGKCAVILTFILIASSVCYSHAKRGRGRQQPECARTCHEVNCDNVSVQYGKYCGVGHGGCPGEEPCDAADACCKQHDDCVGAKHVLANDCHADFIACLEQVMLSGSKGFSRKCPYSLVIPTMKNGIEMTMMFGEMFSGLSAQGNMLQPGAGTKQQKRRKRRGSKAASSQRSSN